LIKNDIIWLRGQDLLKTLQLVLGYEVVAGARNRRYLHLNFAVVKGHHSYAKQDFLRATLL